MFLLARERGYPSRRIDARDCELCPGPILTYNVPFLVSELRSRNSHLPGDVVDLCQVALLLAGQPNHATKASDASSIWSNLRRECGDSQDVTTLWSLFYERRAITSGEDVVSLLDRISIMLEHLWASFCKRLSAQGEYERYWTVEKPVNDIFLQRQLCGIRVDVPTIDRKLNEIDIARARCRKHCDYDGASRTRAMFAKFALRLTQTT